MQRALIIQTAFIGDVILATSLIENLKSEYPELQLDFLVRKGNENILYNNPFINKIIIWDKSNDKYKGLFNTIQELRKIKYDLIVNLQRFFSTGLITALSKGRVKVGFRKNPLSFLYNISFDHKIGNGEHEVERNHKLIQSFVKGNYKKPKVYPSETDYDKVKPYKSQPYITISPSSVWFTKQYPKAKWIEFIDKVPDDFNIYLLGSQDDYKACEEIIFNSLSSKCHNLAGKLSLLQSSALLEDAKMNYVNDSAPMHLASATNSPVSAIFCSTIPAFGFGPLSDKSFIIETEENLKCRPCGLHGKKECPIKNFKCGYNINSESLLYNLD